VSLPYGADDRLLVQWAERPWVHDLLDGAPRVEFVEEPLRYPVGLPGAEPVTNNEDATIAPHLLAQCEIQCLAVGHRRHVCRPHRSQAVSCTPIVDERAGHC